MKRLVIAALAGLVLVGGCGAPEVPQPAYVPPAAQPGEVPEPLAVRIPKLDAESDLLTLGLDETGAMQVPPVDLPHLAGWYAGADTNEDGDETKPGQRGSAVIAGHVDGRGPDGEKGFPGVFARLHELEPGDEVFVEQEGGTELKFVVESVERFAKDALPHERIFRADDAIRLNLITCGGAFDAAAGHYTDNVVAFTKLA